MERIVSKYVKTRLLGYFGDEIVNTTVQKKDNVVTFKGKASKILHMAEETQVLLEPKSNLLNKKEFSGKKKTFLTNRNNKQAFINLLSHKLNIAGKQTSHAIGDADLLTDLTAIVHVYLLSS